MKRLFRSIIQLILTAVALYLVYNYTDGWLVVTKSEYDPNLTFLVLALIFWGLSITVKKIVSVITLPIKWLTFGLFAIVINVVFLYFFEYVLWIYDFGVEIALGEFVQVLMLSFILIIPALLVKKSK